MAFNRFVSTVGSGGRSGPVMMGRNSGSTGVGNGIAIRRVRGFVSLPRNISTRRITELVGRAADDSG